VKEWTVSRWSGGTSRPDEAEQRLLAAVLNMDLEELRGLLPAEADRDAA
jgi:DNA-binding transcriptional regulator YiaG